MGGMTTEVLKEFERRMASGESYAETTDAVPVNRAKVCSCGAPWDNGCTNTRNLAKLDMKYAKGETIYGGRVVSTEEFKHLTSVNPKDLIGAKKLSMTVLPDVAVAHFNHAMQNGAVKYGAFNWRDKSVGALTYINAARRHIAQWLDGEEVAADSGVHHLGHAAACLAILLDAQECGQLVDDRPKNAGGFNRLLGRLNETCSGS